MFKKIFSSIASLFFVSGTGGGLTLSIVSNGGAIVGEAVLSTAQKRRRQGRRQRPQTHGKQKSRRNGHLP